MSTLNQMRSVVDLTNQGWEVVRFPDRPDDNIMCGGPTYMANSANQMIVVVSSGHAYRVDITLETACKNGACFTPE